MEKHEIEICEKMLKLFNDMSFEKLKGSEFTEKFLVFQNFAKVIGKYKNPPKLEPVKEKPIKEVKPTINTSKKKKKGKK